MEKLERKMSDRRSSDGGVLYFRVEIPLGAWEDRHECRTYRL